MSAPILVYTNLSKRMLLALIALGTTKCMFATASYTPDQDAHDFVNDITNEAAGTSYPAGGITLTGVTTILDAATNKVTLDADNITTAGLSVSCRWGILYIATGSTATSPLLAYVDFSGGAGGNVTVTEVDWDAAGIIPFVAA